MESNSYGFEDRSFVGTLAMLTHDILRHSSGASVSAPAKTVALPRRSWLDRLDNWFWRQELKSREAYLAQAVDIVDLEQRMRLLERGRA